MKLKNIVVGGFVQIKKGHTSYCHTPHTNYIVKSINFSSGIAVFCPNSDDYCFYCPEDLRKGKQKGTTLKNRYTTKIKCKKCGKHSVPSACFGDTTQRMVVLTVDILILTKGKLRKVK